MTAETIAELPGKRIQVPNLNLPPELLQIEENVEPVSTIKSEPKAIPNGNPARRGRPPGSKDTQPRKTRTNVTKVTNVQPKTVAIETNDKSLPPDFSEWQEFLGAFVLHWLSVAFIKVCFRGIPNYEHHLSQEDQEDIELDDNELNSIARPFAHLLTHSGLNSKYGRAIMNSRDSLEATVIIFMWGNRVRRVAKRHRAAYNEAMEAQNVRHIGVANAGRNGTSIGEADSGESESAPQFNPATYRPAFGTGYN
jgi:hypothetical protein